MIERRNSEPTATIAVEIGVKEYKDKNEFYSFNYYSK